MTDHLIIGVQPEYMIQASPFQLGDRISSVTTSFQNRGLDIVGFKEPVRIPDADKSAAPVSDNDNGLDRKPKIPQTLTSGMLIQRPSDGQTHLADRASQVKDGYDIAIITQVNDMLSKENYSGAEIILGRELTEAEIINRQLGVLDRYSRAKAGLPTFNRVQTETIEMEGFIDPNKKKKKPPPVAVPAVPAAITNNAQADFSATNEQKTSQSVEIEATGHIADQALTVAQLIARSKATIARANEAMESRKRKHEETGGSLHSIPFGRFTMHGGKLDQNIVSLKYTHNNKKVSDIPNKHVSEPLKRAVQALSENKPISGTGLDDSDVAYLHKLAHRAQLSRASVPLPPTKQRNDRLMVLMGEIEAGNDGDGVKDELAKLVAVMRKAKQLTTAKAKLILQTFL
jgi:hypothetical protein